MTFETAVAFILEREGGYVNDPNDPGGETKFGISKRAYPDLDIPNLTRAEATAIYRRRYWDACRCSELPNGLDLLTFDAAVNQGTNAAIKMLQRALNVKDDGVIGPVTMAAALASGKDMTAEYGAQRMLAYGLNPNFSRYGLGWSRRLMKAVLLTA